MILSYQKITGYVNRTQVVAFVYPGADSGLNHYTIDGKTHMGNVKFTDILRTEEVPYT
jgi:hypothetical protein